MFDKLAVFVAGVLGIAGTTVTLFWPNAPLPDMSTAAQYEKSTQACLVGFRLGVQEVLIDKREKTVSKVLSACEVE